MQPLLLDTCAVIWAAGNEELSLPAVEVIDAAHDARAVCYVSPITAWEVGMLVARGHIHLLITPQRWFKRLFEVPNVRLAELSPDLLAASSSLPGLPPRDPADRIIAATAREYGATIITRDRSLLNYGDQGHVRVVAC